MRQASPKKSNKQIRHTVVNRFNAGASKHDNNAKPQRRTKRLVPAKTKLTLPIAKKNHPKIGTTNKKRWIKGDFEKTTKFRKHTDEFDKYSCFSPTELFELFFSDEVWDHILIETTRYALSINCPDPKITKAELKCFFGILIVSGYNVLPGKKFF